MGIKFVPFKELIDSLNFKEIEASREHIALIGDEEIGRASFISITSKEAMEHWKKEIRQALLRHSSTVVLRTACGCEQVKDLRNRGELRTLLIPLMWTSSAIGALNDDAEPNPFDVYHAREFRWENRYHESGAKLMEEQIKR